MKSKFSFVLIGGWAVYLYTNALKSKDIDVLVSLNVLREIQSAYPVTKNLRLKKYEFVAEGVSVDVYVEYYSEIGIPAEDIISHRIQVSGFEVPVPEHLLVTKQKAEMERRGSEKGFKDRVDIISMLLYSNLDLKAYTSVLMKYNKWNYLSELESIVSNAREEFKQLGFTDLRKVKVIKRKILKNIQEARTAER